MDFPSTSIMYLWMSNIRKEYIRGTAEIEHFGKKLEVRLRYSGHVQRWDSEYIGLHNIMNMEMHGRKKRESDHTHTISWI